ncbi:hypothetical protein ES332_D11G229600v1 [Gossypium tomentosum]|uniref:Uncharacterized protein n=1 Tax=Gossypium tomentosum TaxID=34277 RepID=A0A5D2IQQ7_GOSTO|nr:hypothetical protein ES332_D11G229600v1 [Gossypium tomentosum]
MKREYVTFFSNKVTINNSLIPAIGDLKTLQLRAVTGRAREEPATRFFNL